ncbi:Hsp20/alpha crystallin family protein [Natrononativus amylolyticus]|uniref:Hsp20/alpha crystallin family protein n=1 Tax=Natrononativus amylolyticus TaxID=2963434 RepID=UPI0020CCF155|nr:Hsp20/alpha crystallin family protein [Natrononativus amylolyticus]
MSDEDDTDRETSEAANAPPGGHRKGTSLGAALEASLQAGLQSLSDGLGKLVEDDAGGASSSSRRVRPRPSRTGKRTSRKQRAERANRTRTKRASPSASDDCLIDTRLADGEFMVIADIPGASKDDLSVGVNPKTNELVISKTGTVVGRVDLPWESPEMSQAWFKNGVLEVYMTSDDPKSHAESPP